MAASVSSDAAWGARGPLPSSASHATGPPPSARKAKPHWATIWQKLLGNAAAQRDGEPVLQVPEGVKATLEPLGGGGEEREAACTARSRHDGHLGDRVVVIAYQRHHGVANLVVRHEPLAPGKTDATRPLLADGKPVERVIHLAIRDGTCVVASGDDGRLIHQISQRGAGEADSSLREQVEVHAMRERFVARVHREDCTPPLDVGQIDWHAAVKAAGAEQGWVEQIGAVGCGEDDHPLIALKAVHLGEDLVKSLFALA
eukprot:scaffold163549_cov31-Tisochrysis_lutea.AAC.5